MVFIVTVPCHCLSLTLHFFLGPFLFWLIKALSKLKEDFFYFYCF